MSKPDIGATVESRLVTIPAIEFTEDAPKAGTVTFTLPVDLRHTLSGTIIAAGSRTVTLVDGRAELRLFTDQPGLESDYVTRYGDSWAILVKKSWQSQPYPIRVPPGSVAISLARIPVFDWRNP